MAERKRVQPQPEERNEPESKRSRTDDHKGPAKNTMKLTDVIDDCLEHVFMDLSLEDLLNIADTNKELKPAADMAFRRKFGKMEFQLDKDRFQCAIKLGEHIVINDKKTQLQLLRCFGHSVTKLVLRPPGVFSRRLISYANKFCFNSLTDIKIMHFDFTRNNFLNKLGEKTVCGFSQNKFKLKKRFRNVEVVSLSSCQLYADTNLKKLFPAMRRLDLFKCSTVTEETLIVKNTPKLEHLEMTCDRRISAENICTTLRSNPQLRSLSLIGIVPPKDFWNICQTLYQLESLRFDSIYCVKFKHADIPINLPTLEKLDINIGKKDQRLMTSEKNKITFGQLKEIKLECMYSGWLPSINSHKWSNFFKKNKLIEKMTLWFYETDINICETIITEAAQELPLLNEFILYGRDFSVEEILRFIGKFNMMSYGFEMENVDEFYNLKERLGVEWTASIDDAWAAFVINVSRKL
ncbi:uncharacterized protein LOC116347459 [Contarinia nasturtii]|uniref:uncharacterized protein LOC116347459 n=1 Tax=Contarinia nasturtii TaxID=265458 RepID=UPI0012D37C0C|nr:uncharacterized protein LOC116347459 [Contarinia nasturtii]